ncbi:MAG: serine protease [bacterium]|nr:serine protease [bacterium]
MNKTLLKLFFVAFFGGIIGALFLSIIDSGVLVANLERTVNDQKEASINTPIPTPHPELWEKIVINLSPSLVGVQTISENRVIRQGSGIIVSSDGLIVTMADLLGSKGSVYQVFYDDKIIKGELVTVDSKINLLLLKTSVLNSNIAELNSSDYRSGQEVLVIGKTFYLSKPTVISQKGIVSQVTDKLVIIDTVPSKYLYGFGVSDKEGRLRGVAYLRNGVVSLVKTEVIENFFKSYLEKSPK